MRAVLCLALGLVPTAHSAWSLMAVPLLHGAADGCTSVAMNAQAVSVQQWYGRAVLNSMHAIHSVGALTGGLSTLVGLPTALGLLAVAAATIAGLAPVTCSVAPVRTQDRQGFVADDAR